MIVPKSGMCSGNTCLHNVCPQFPRLFTMAKPKKTASGTYRIQIDVKGVRDAATFPTARECNEWAAHRRVELLAAAAGGRAGARLLGETKTLNDAVLRYKEEVSPLKRGWRWELLRIEAFMKHPKWPGDRPMSELDEQDLIGWKNERRKTKTGQGRIVPLSKSAVRNVESMRGYDYEFVFGIGEGTLDVIFRRCRERAGLSGFTFHDSRHTAATRIAQKLHLLDLCKMFGWSDPKRAMTYYNPTAEQIAVRLDAPTPGAGAGSPNPSPLRAATSHPSQAWP